MSKDIKVLKITNYDQFKCIADKCKFTCCSGWDINVDNETYKRWKVSKCGEELIDNLKLIDKEDGKEYFINKETNESCKFLDKKGLCNLVKEYGEDFLSVTCHTFPRIKNEFEDRTEFTLNCSCPEVMNLLSKTNIKFGIESLDIEEDIDLLEIIVRKRMINILRMEEYLIEERLLMVFEMLNSICFSESLNRENILENLDKYKDKSYLDELRNAYKSIHLDIYESFEELGNLFLDITENYEEVENIGDLLKALSNFIRNQNNFEMYKKWYDFKVSFNSFNELMEKFIISKVISSCVNEDFKENLIVFQMIILEYLLVRYAAFVKYCIDNTSSICEENIKDYVVIFSRIIGNNTEAMKEFIKESFETEFLELGYLYFIALF